LCGVWFFCGLQCVFGLFVIWSEKKKNNYCYDDVYDRKSSDKDEKNEDKDNEKNEDKDNNDNNRNIERHLEREGKKEKKSVRYSCADAKSLKTTFSLKQSELCV